MLFASVLCVVVVVAVVAVVVFVVLQLLLLVAFTGFLYYSFQFPGLKVALCVTYCGS